MTTKKAASKKSPATPNESSSSSTQPLVDAQPQSKQKAALQAGMFLYTNDAWSTAYFNEGDLHCVERVLFS